MSGSTDPSLYHEKQAGSLCAVHATNNLLGARRFTQADFTRMQDAVPDDGPQGWCQKCCFTLLNICPHCCCQRCRTKGGNFDANVIMMALLEEKIEIQFWDRRNNNVEQLLRELDSQECVGALLNTSAESHSIFVAMIIKCLAFCFGKNGHWIALRKLTSGSGNKYLDLDSKRTSPQTYNIQNIQNFLTSHLRANTSILLAKRIL